MERILPWMAAKQNEVIALLRRMVECESPSDSPAAVGRFADLLAAETSDFAKMKRFDGGRFGPNVLLEFALPGPRRKRPGRVLGVGHGDTVWPLGTLASMPWRESDGRLWGPGVLDMKGGLAFFVYAMRCLRELDIPVGRPVALWVVSDEEVGSEGSRPRTEALAKESFAALVLEPGTGLEGRHKTSRKGVGDYTVRVRGKASHAGVDFGAGASAIVELARQIERIAGFTDLKKGITVNPGVIRGGTRTNVVAAEAEVEVDIRLARMRDAAALDRKFRGLKPVDRRCSIEVEGGVNRPPMERTAGVGRLFRMAQQLGVRHLGRQLEESSTGGGSDGNFTAALGVPTLDGIGTVGEGAHAPNESILADRIADRAALLALLVAQLGETERLV
jgi:glutamate carboxypeptidase